jgi:Ricin-type beta-trefoil lectin domain-like
MSRVQDGKNYIIMNVKTKTVIDLAHGRSENGTAVTGYELLIKDHSPNQPNQIWKAKLAHSDGPNQWYLFINQKSGTALDLDRGRGTNGNKIQGWRATAANTNQQWLVSRVRRSHVPCYQ